MGIGRNIIRRKDLKEWGSIYIKIWIVRDRLCVRIWTEWDRAGIWILIGQESGY